MELEQDIHNPVLLDVPKIGMEFESDESAYNFYNSYGRSMGFSIRKEYCNKNKKTGEVTSRKLTCSKEGFRGKDKRDQNVSKHRDETRSGCKAHMTISRNKITGKLQVSSFASNHNHPLHILECAHMMLSQRKMSRVQASEIDLADDSGIRLKNSYEYMSKQAGGRENLGYTQQDHKNYLRTKRQRDLEFGVAAAMLDYFQKQSLKSSSFYHAVQLDIDEQITNVFWTDAKMVLDYSQFGDVVSFDTTYKTNKDYRPFGIFVGFNQYRGTTIFGAALMYDETIDSFQWLFQTFINAMSGKKPQTIFTDQDVAMAKALSVIMPDTYHRLCIWHMMENCAKHLSHMLFANDGTGIQNALSVCIYECETEKEFYDCWNAMLDKYNVRENNWLASIFELKEKWANPFVKMTFSAGMGSTQLSESLNSDLKQFLKCDHDLIQFFKHFERVVNDKRYNESKAEYELREKLPNLKMKTPMLKQAAVIYTRTIFEEFQREYEKFLSATIGECRKNGQYSEYKVSIYGRNKEYVVNVDVLENTVVCSCKKMETFGILCCHSLKVLDEMNIKLIPEKYIMKRWTKSVRDALVQATNGTDILTGLSLEVIERYRCLCPKFVRLVAQSAQSEEAYSVATDCYKDFSKKLENVLRSQNVDAEATVVQDANLEISNVVRAKELKKKDGSKGRRRHKRSLEKGVRKYNRQNNKRTTNIQASKHGQYQSSNDHGCSYLTPGCVVNNGVEVPTSTAWMTCNESNATGSTSFVPTSFTQLLMDCSVPSYICQEFTSNDHVENATNTRL